MESLMDIDQVTITLESMPVEIITMIASESDPLTAHMLSLCRADWYGIANRCGCGNENCTGVCPNPYAITADAAVSLALANGYLDLLRYILNRCDIYMSQRAFEISCMCYPKIAAAVKEIMIAAKCRGNIKPHDWLASPPKCRWMLHHFMVTQHTLARALCYGRVDAVKIFTAGGFKLTKNVALQALKSIESVDYVLKELPEAKYITVRNAAHCGTIDVLKYMIEELGMKVVAASATCCAIMSDNVECLDYLLRNNHQVNMPMELAIGMARIKCVKLLHKTRPVRASDLNIAISHGDPEVVRFILDNLTDPAAAIKECLIGPVFAGLTAAKMDAILDLFRLYVTV